MAEETQTLLAELRRCFSESLPSVEQRRALAGALRARASLVELSEVAAQLEQGETRAQIAVLAARAMRLLMQSEALAGAEAEGDAAPDVREATRDALAARKQRRSQGLARRQDRALRAEAAATDPLHEPVERLSGVGRALGLALRARELHTLGDLLWFLPLGFHDERELAKISQLRSGERQVTEGKVVSARYGGGARGRRMAEVVLEDDQDPAGGRLRLVWFHVPGGLLQRFAVGERFRAAGMVEVYRGAPSMTHPQTEWLRAGAAAAATGIVPRYAPVPGVPPKTLGKLMRAAVRRAAPFAPDAVPAALRAREGLGSLRDALRALHEPPSELFGEGLAEWNEGRSPHHLRLALEEFFLLELSLARRQAEDHGTRAVALEPVRTAVERAGRALPFELTAAQARAVQEITADLQSERPMRRLLQGDVGSGKTAVALLAAAHAISAGGQVAFMAPTELLAEQHFSSLEALSEAMGLRAALVVGGARASHKSRTRKALAEGRLDLVVGTHALLVEGVQFHALRLVIVDEQHRFGVGQRLRLVDKAGVDKAGVGLSPHLLVMTATPIPRTLALAVHGELSASVIDELPPGRVPPVTRAYRVEQRGEALRQLERALESDGQAYVVCPTIEPSEEHGLKSALEVYDELRERFERQGVALLHGALPNDEKHAALARFASGQVRVLVSTTIIEVGIDVPRANCILIENAERFGLAQLHQLRGRVGRAGQRSACLLVHEAASQVSRERIAALCECHDGFRLAEEDLRLRGPGELFGHKQSGLPGFRFGDLRRDQPLLVKARALARELCELDPELAREDHAEAREALERMSRAIVKEEAG